MIYTFQHCLPFLSTLNIPTQEIEQPEWIVKNGSTVREILAQLKTIDKPFYAFFYSAGTRILYPFAAGYDSKQSIARFSGRRIRLWHVFVDNGIKIQLGYIKVDILNKCAMEECIQLLETDASTFWSGKGAKYLNSCGGKLFPHKKLFQMLKTAK